ncbi:hypothetical protein BO71DRAFT_409030 [Aspergillus ellipticus CBS 707.79]|uniref:Uncharacterized protein n=1 Tax=Aspergillus ellipticus CBS 707.79 TaxID=1448320 RepID=A0A319DLD2_9EURO|nr:hypothetical protein BO71DRAFT_409030 [Aspergillus ellipticus CBS 707.79]
MRAYLRGQQLLQASRHPGSLQDLGSRCLWLWGGDSRQQDNDKLQAWCTSQYEWDSSKNESVFGDTVTCYFYNNRAQLKFGYTGCNHVDENRPRPGLRNYLIGVFKENGQDKYYLMCSGMTEEARDALAKKYLNYNGQCRDAGTDDYSHAHAVRCPFVSQGGAHERAVAFHQGGL